MEIHRFIALSVCAMLHKARVAAFDLDTAASFLLDMLYVSTTVTYYLCSEIEARDWLEINGNALFRPFALQGVSLPEHLWIWAYSSKLITLNLIWLSTSKTSLVHKVWQFLLHKFVDLFHRLFKTIFRSAGNVEIEGRILSGSVNRSHHQEILTYRCSGHAFIRIIVSSGGDIFTL